MSIVFCSPCPYEILLCFTCDPYPTGIDTTWTRDVLNILELYKLKVTILTKAGNQCIRDFDILARNKWRFGMTFTSCRDASVQRTEPRAANPWERMALLSAAHESGIRTWVSIEPVLDAAEALEVIETLRSRKIVDSWKVGKWNHAPPGERQPDWKMFLQNARHILKDEQVYWKKDLLEAAGEKPV